MIDWALIGQQSIHPLQRRILERLADSPIPLSPVKLAGEFDQPLGNVSYHVKVLVKNGWVKPHGTEPRRGAVEHYYVIAPRVYL